MSLFSQLGKKNVGGKQMAQSILAKLLNKRIKTAAQPDVEDLAAKQKELIAISRKLNRTLRELSSYLNLPAKVQILPAEIMLYSYEVQKAKERLDSEVKLKAVPEVKKEDKKK
jgi:wyosine [tRNA(Phe)-imidazoG37] synthetase (radical SAM superfamily)